MIMCGVDGSDGGLDAARVAGELSRRLAAGLLLVHVSEPVPRFRMSPESFAAAQGFEREQARAVLADGARASGIGDDAEFSRRRASQRGDCSNSPRSGEST